MAFWRTLLGIVTGGAYRVAGVQSGLPGSYSAPSATPVNVDTALALSTVWACTKLNAETIGSLPLYMYEVKDNGEEVRVKQHNLAMMLDSKMNRWQTRQEFIESIVYQKVLLGNDYSAIQRDSNGKEIIALTPLMTEQMRVILSDSGAIRYEYTDGANLRVFDSSSIWHNKMFGNGIIGLSPLGFARNSIGIGQAAEKSVGKIYENGGKPSGVLMIDRVLKDDQRKQVRENYKELTEGENNRLFILEAAMKYEQVSLSPQDIELLASRRYQVEDVARFFGVPSVLINDTQSSTSWGSGVQEIVRGWYKVGLRPNITRMQDSMRANLLTVEEQKKFVFRFDLDDLLQPEFSERVKTGKEAVTGGLMTPDEWRTEEGYAPKGGGDKLYLQQQMTPIEQLKDVNRGAVANSTGQTNEQ